MRLETVILALIIKSNYSYIKCSHPEGRTSSIGGTIKCEILRLTSDSKGGSECEDSSFGSVFELTILESIQTMPSLL